MLPFFSIVVGVQDIYNAVLMVGFFSSSYKKNGKLNLDDGEVDKEQNKTKKKLL